MPQSDFTSHLVRKGALHNLQELDAAMAARRRDSLGDILTRQSPPPAGGHLHDYSQTLISDLAADRVSIVQYRDF
jgi:hypothetical protein